MEWTQAHTVYQPVSWSEWNGKIKISIQIYGRWRKNDVQMNLSILHAIQNQAMVFEP